MQIVLSPVIRDLNRVKMSWWNRKIINRQRLNERQHLLCILLSLLHLFAPFTHLIPTGRSEIIFIVLIAPISSSRIFPIFIARPFLGFLYRDFYIIRQSNPFM